MGEEIPLDRQAREDTLLWRPFAVPPGARIRLVIATGGLQPVRRVSPTYRSGLEEGNATQQTAGQGSARQRGGYRWGGVAARGIPRRCFLPGRCGRASGEPPVYGVRAAAQRRSGLSGVHPRAVRNTLQRGPRDYTFHGRAGEE